MASVVGAPVDATMKSKYQPPGLVAHAPSPIDVTMPAPYQHALSPVAQGGETLQSPHQAPSAYAPSPGGPPWPYPQLGARKTSGFNLVFGIGMLLGGLFAMGMCALVLPMAIAPQYQSRNNPYGGYVFFVFPLIGLGLLVMGVVSIISAIKQKGVANRLFLEGVPCWARVVSSTPGNNMRRVNAIRWIELVIQAEPYAAFSRTRIAQQIKIDWFVSELQMSLTQPGAWLAVLVHPRTHQVHLDGFATPDGTFIATQ